MKLEGKIAVVTGAASGIGRRTAGLLAEGGVAALALVDLDAAGLEQTAAQLSAVRTLEINCDVADEAALRALYQRVTTECGGLDIVFNNAGIPSGPPPFPDTDLTRIKLVININLTSVIQSSMLAIRYMRDHGGGVIINTASTAGLHPFMADAPYNSSKAGVIMFSRCCADLYEQYGIRVNAVCPGATATPILEKTGGGQRPDWLTDNLKDVELLTADAIAQTVLDIIADDNMAGEFIVMENKLKSSE